MTLRQYQKLCLDSILEDFKKHSTTMFVIPTGGGKTVVFSHLIKSMQPMRVLVLAHRTELIEQARKSIERITGFQCDVEKAEQCVSPSMFHDCKVVVSSIQTQCSGKKDARRYMKFNPMDFGLVICDECHRSVSSGWREVIKYYQRNPNLKVVGCTATPDRHDKEALGQVFQSVAYEYGILDAIQDGWLVDITQQYISVKSLDFSHVRTTAGDLNEGDLSKLMESEENIQSVCQPTLECIFHLKTGTLKSIQVPEWREYLQNHLKETGKKPRRTIVFTVSVVQAEMCANIFNRVMDGVGWVCGATNKEKRKTMLEQFHDGRIHVVVNVGVLTEGFDNPNVEVIVMARPTKSRALYAQCIGRATRPPTGLVDGIESAEERRRLIAACPKPYCRVLDFVGNSGRHKLISVADILGGKVSEEAVALATEIAKEKGTPVKMLVTLTNAQIELEKKHREEQDRKRKEEELKKAAYVAKTDHGVVDVNPFDGHSKVPTKLISQKVDKPLTDPMKWTLRKGSVPIHLINFKQGIYLCGVLKKNNYKLPPKEQAWMDSLIKKHQYVPPDQQAMFDWKTHLAKQVA